MQLEGRVWRAKKRLGRKGVKLQGRGGGILVWIRYCLLTLLPKGQRGKSGEDRKEIIISGYWKEFTAKGAKLSQIS